MQPGISPVPSIPYTATCPAPTCACGSTPRGLDIDRTTPLLNTMAPYAEQVLLCTGKEDWASNLEDDGATGEFVKGLKSVIGKGAPGFDPFTNILITASSLPTTGPQGTTTALLFPSFTRLPCIPHTRPAFTALATAYLAAPTPHPLHTTLPSHPKPLLRDPAAAALLPTPERITTPTFLVCGHGGRDARCGALGPLLQDAFRRELARRGIMADVALVSHVGGHKYAGNVIVYVPPGGAGAEAEAEAGSVVEGEGSALAGCGIWYGRVGVEQVEGVVEETLVRGRVVGELLRGGVVRGGGNLGRMVEAQIRGTGEGEQGLRLRPRARA
ncbi:hypothetical protein EJ07DRAFT_162514 [Lizonia empirigonia]|nr:hypothetical protein EJ07DRAFT_162514 [Lizonia empirigonia]